MNPVELKQNIDNLKSLLEGWKTDGRSHPARWTFEEDLEAMKAHFKILQSSFVLNPASGRKTPCLEYFGIGTNESGGIQKAEDEQ